MGLAGNLLIRSSGYSELTQAAVYSATSRRAKLHSGTTDDGLATMRIPAKRRTTIAIAISMPGNARYGSKLPCLTLMAQQVTRVAMAVPMQPSFQPDRTLS